MAPAYTQQLLDRAQAYTEQPLTARRSAEGLAELASIYSAITGQPVGSCRQCQYSDFLAAVANYIRAATRFLHPELMSESKYAIAPGLENETFVHDAYGKAVTAENLEDKDVEFFKSKGLGSSFVLKSKAEAPAATATDGSAPAGDPPKEDEAQKKLKEEVATGKNALKSEKDAHAATKKELTDTKKELAKATKALADAQSALDKATAKPAATEPATDAVVDPGATA